MQFLVNAVQICYAMKYHLNQSNYSTAITLCVDWCLLTIEALSEQPPTILMLLSCLMCCHLCATQEYTLINKRKSLDPSKYCEARQIFSDIFPQACLYLCDGIYVSWHFCCLSIMSSIRQRCGSEVPTDRSLMYRNTVWK